MFLAYISRMEEAARRNYELEMLVWATLAPHQKRQTKQPDLPAILRRLTR
jgi:hypothetical protein